MVKIGVLISGGGTNLQCLIDNTENGNIDGKIDFVISNKKQAYGLERCRKHNIDHRFLDPKDFSNIQAYNDKILDIFKSRGIELIVLAGYLRILSGDILKHYENKIINIHPSLIPSFCGDGYYGHRVHEAVIDYGCKLTGATVHFVDEGTDTGPIILQESVEVKEDDSVESLHKRVLKIEHKILVESVALFCRDCIEIDKRRVKINRGEY